MIVVIIRSCERNGAIESGQLGRLLAAHSFFWLYKPDDYFEIQSRREKGAGPAFLKPDSRYR
jgi:hypothetical protein